MPRSLIVQVVDIAGNGDVTFRTLEGKESNEWAERAFLTLSSPDETYDRDAVHELTISDRLG